MTRKFISTIILSTLSFALLVSGFFAVAFASEGYSGNNCLIFNGDDYYAVCGQSTIYQLDNCTIEMWIKPEHTIQTGSDSLYGHNLGYLVNRINTMSGDGYALRFDYRSGSLYFVFANWATYEVHTNKAIWYNNTWYHITLTYDRSLQNGNIKFYVNGTLDSEHDHTVSIRHKDQQLNIGTYVDDYAGLIDEVRIWNVARTQSEIQETMMRTLDETEVTTPNLVGYWRFDEGTGINSKDFSIYGNDATLLNDIEWYSPGVSIIPEFSNISIIIICALIVIPVAIIKRKINKDT